jgi:hypothetical protein
MLANPSRLKLLAETARQRAVQERALILTDDPGLDINWGTLFEDDVQRDFARRARENGKGRQQDDARWLVDES